MSGFYPFLTLGDVDDYLPNFNPDYDLQVGDWVVVQPWRVSTLLGPLIAAWERDSAAQKAAVSGTPYCSAPQYKLEQLLPEPLNLRRRALTYDGANQRAPPSRFPRLAPLSMARAQFCQRKRGHLIGRSARRDDEASCEYADAESENLYFHMRLGLLTPSRPFIFGGLDIVEILAWPSEDDSAEEDMSSDASSDSNTMLAPSVMYLNLLTGETLTREDAVSRVSNALSYNAATTWSSPFEEAAEREWQQWVARKACKHMQPQTCS